jgi:hypothetical protein
MDSIEGYNFHVESIFIWRHTKTLVFF